MSLVDENKLRRERQRFRKGIQRQEQENWNLVYSYLSNAPGLEQKVVSKSSTGRTHMRSRKTRGYYSTHLSTPNEIGRTIYCKKSAQINS